MWFSPILHEHIKAPTYAAWRELLFPLPCTALRMYKTIQEISSAVSSAFKGLGLSAEDFLLITNEKLLATLAKLSASQAGRLEKFKEMAPTAKMYDLSQNPQHRLRVGGDTMLTLTKTCSSIWLPSSSRCFCPMVGLSTYLFPKKIQHKYTEYKSSLVESVFVCCKSSRVCIISLECLLVFHPLCAEGLVSWWWHMGFPSLNGRRKPCKWKSTMSKVWATGAWTVKSSFREAGTSQSEG